ncbi:MAG: hypothetical protein WC091_00540 [Sulfuricellaceae bacterium]
MSANATHEVDGENPNDKFIDATGFYHNPIPEESEKSKYPWAGPAFFVATLIALIVFFTWFLRA